MVHQKRMGVINVFTSFHLIRNLNEINIYTDAGRCCRPLIVDNGQ